MRELKDVTLCIIDCSTYGDAVNAVLQSLKQIKPSKVLFFTDIELNVPNIEVVKIPHIHSKEEYSYWIIKELGKQDIQTSHVLICQYDGYILDGEQWKDEFLNYDYIGAVWPQEIDNFSVGNGGFSLRSTRLLKILAEDELIKGLHPEDAQICRLYRSYLEDKYQIKFAPPELANLFSFELGQPPQPTFGFHGKFHSPYFKEPIVFKRDAALGDCVTLEPVFEHYHKLGHPIVFDSQFYDIFARHHFQVIDYARFDHSRIRHRLINLNMAYEVFPQQLHLKSYFEMCGAKDYVLRNARLNYVMKDEHRLFKQKYIVIHIDERDTEHRNIKGVDWYAIAAHLEALGYLVVQIGRNSKFKIGVQFNTLNNPLMMWLIRGSNYFLGIDSGPSHIAVALGIPCILTFGSVDPTLIHADLTNIFAIRAACPIQQDGCWHLEPGTMGRLCPIDSGNPPCTRLSTEIIMDAIKQMGV